MLKRLTPFAAPVLTAGLLLGMTAADKLRVDPSEADGFHTSAAAAVAAVPKEFGPFMSVGDIAPETDAAEMLKPNAYLHRKYYNFATGTAVEVLLVQCRDTRDMQGHYPPVCYPSHGCTMPAGVRHEWPTGAALTVPGTEYSVTWPGGQRMTIRNFFVLPNGKIVADMESVNAAAKDYRELAYGVAQVQLLFDASVGEAQRDAAFSSFVSANRRLIDALRTAANLVPSPRT